MNKRLFFSVVLIVFVILITILYTSYGFYSGKIIGNEESKKAVFNAQILEVTFSDGEETLTSKQDKFVPGSTITKTFTITNTGNVPVKYSINLSDVLNDFKRYYDLTYSIKNSDGSINESGIFPQEDTYIVKKDILSVNESETYSLTINYLNSEENQIADTGKTINAKITIDETVKTIKSLTFYGNSIQEGKNIFELGTSTDYTFAVSSPVISGNTITATGANGNATYAYKNTKYTSGKYLINANFSGLSRFIVQLYDGNNTILDNASTTINGWTYNTYYKGWFKDSTSATVEIPESVSSWKLGFVFFTGTSGEKASVSDIKLSLLPSPTNPVEIESLGTSRNILNVNDLVEMYSPFIFVGYKPTFEKFDDKDCLKIYGTLTAEGRAIKYMQGEFKENTQYTISLKKYDITALNSNGVAAEGIVMYVVYTDGVVKNVWVGDNIHEEWEEIIYTSLPEKTIDYVKFSYSTGGAYSYIYDWQIKEGNIITEYDPYNKYKLTLKSDSKNLFNKYDVDYLIGYFNKNTSTITTHANARTIIIPCEPNTTYTVSRNSTNSQFHAGYTDIKPTVGGAVKWVDGTSDPNIKSLKITTGENAKYLVLYVFNGYSATTDFWDEIIAGLQIEKGDTASNYEAPFFTKIYLDEPLRKIGNIENSADYIDFLNKKLIKNTAELILTGTENISKYSSYNTYYINNLPARYSTSVLTLSNSYTGNFGNGGNAYGSGNVWVQSTEQYPRLYISNDNHTTLEEFKEYLSNQYNNGVPVKIYYLLSSSDPIMINNIEILNEVVPKNIDKINVCSDNDICASKVEVEFDE